MDNQTLTVHRVGNADRSGTLGINFVGIRSELSCAEDFGKTCFEEIPDTVDPPTAVMCCGITKWIDKYVIPVRVLLGGAAVLLIGVTGDFIVGGVDWNTLPRFYSSRNAFGVGDLRTELDNHRPRFGRVRVVLCHLFAARWTRNLRTVLPTG